MAFLKKFLFNYNSKKIIKYGTFPALALYLFVIVQIWSIRYDVGYNVFSYSDDELSYAGTKYILVWDHYYLLLNHKKEQIFPGLQCPVNNCVFTEDKELLHGDYTLFDALLFTESILRPRVIGVPEKRSNRQIYIFTTIESSYHYPACEVESDNFFNWTFTYRVNSDLIWRYFLVRDVNRKVVAPSMHVRWQKYDDGLTIAPEIFNLFHKRSKVAAWMVSHCDADSSRDEYLTRLQEHLFHFSLQIDVFGNCSKVKCTYDDCSKMLREDYYFYMAFENSFSEDYVTEKVLHGYDNYVVPIVYGAANYSRILPPGSYINARELHPYNLAYIMYQAIINPEKYHEYFKWTNYYTIDSVDDVPQLHPLCDLCAALNSDKMRRPRTLDTFRLWWNGRNGFQWCLSKEYWNETSLLHVDRQHLFNMY